MRIGERLMRQSWIVALLFGVAPVSAIADGPVIIAHRGASGYLPEHTLEAAAMAHAQGADYIEQDVVLTKDRVPVVLHDVQIDAVTNVARKFPDRKRADGRWYAIDFTLEELKSLNVNERVNPKTGVAVLPKRFPVGRGTFRIPTLEEELQLIEGLNASTGRRAGIYPELKAAAWHREQGAELAPVVIEVLTRYGYNEKNALCYLQSFEFDELRNVRETLKYQGKLVYLLGGRRGPDGLDPATAEGLTKIAKVADGVGPALPLVIRKGQDGAYEATDFVKLAHDAKLEVHPYTIRADALPSGIDTPEAIYRLVFDLAGVDGVFADHPDLGVQFLRAKPTANR